MDFSINLWTYATIGTVLLLLIIVVVFLAILKGKNNTIKNAKDSARALKVESSKVKQQQEEYERLFVEKNRKLNERKSQLDGHYANIKEELDYAKQTADTIISNAEAEKGKIKAKAIKQGKQDIAQDIKEAESQVQKIKLEKEQTQNLLNAIKSELGDIEGFYDYSIPSTVDISYEMDSEHVKSMLTQKKEEQKALKKQLKAFKGDVGHLLLRAFESESSSHLGKVTPRNLSKTREKLTNAFTTINKIGDDFNSKLNDEVLHLKIDELSIYHSYSVIKEKEREEQRAIREQMREEAAAQREHEKAIKEAEKQELQIKKALQKAESEMLKASEEKQSEYEAKLTELRAQLSEAEGMHKRAESMAQLTKRGYVYIISNIGSFGDDMFKIGMTRRLEPMDRVKELGDASVPFPFDVHGMIFSDNAPALESELHKVFSSNRTNKVNLRKEFFNVGIQEIQDKVLEMGHEVELTLVADAYQYMETLNINKENMKAE